MHEKEEGQFVSHPANQPSKTDPGVCIRLAEPFEQTLVVVVVFFALPRGGRGGGGNESQVISKQAPEAKDTDMQRGLQDQEELGWHVELHHHCPSPTMVETRARQARGLQLIKGVQ